MIALISPLYPWALLVITAVYLGACTFKNRDRKPSKLQEESEWINSNIESFLDENPEPLYYSVIKKYNDGLPE